MECVFRSEIIRYERRYTKRMANKLSAILLLIILPI